ncbi:hypothetical protein [Enterovibrio calviensis]|uniref:hypothetical protein n=1 Tax=Enterovibrio calviensis TaxID=91359 RepID=UPI000482176D|nr:hypothetical protein [Enterovibrio calviensis]
MSEFKNTYLDITAKDYLIKNDDGSVTSIKHNLGSGGSAATAYNFATAKSDFDAMRFKRKSDNAGSGFLEWGTSPSGATVNRVNEGMYSFVGDTSLASLMYLGRSDTDSQGTSRTKEAIAVVDGVSLFIDDSLPKAAKAIKFPPAPNGTKTYDSATGTVVDFTKDVDPKYGDVASDTNEAVARAFEGKVINGDFRQGTASWGSTNAATVGMVAGVMRLTQDSEGNGQLGSVGTGLKLNTPYRAEIVIKSSTAPRIDFLMDSEFYPLKVGVNVIDFTLVTHTSTSAIVRHAYANAGEYTEVVSVSIRPVSDKVITTRKDLAFLEVWHETVAEKDVIYPFGNVQYGSTSWEGLALDNELVAQGYSAFGEWDELTTGYGIKASTLSFLDMCKLTHDPRNNLYYDAETKHLVQVRYRIRVVEGLGDDWLSIYNFNSVRALRYKGDGNDIGVRAQGTLDVSTDWADFGNASEGFYQSSYSGFEGDSSDVSVFQAPNASDTNNPFALPIALVQRLNQGAYHPVHNPMGCRAFNTVGVWSHEEWYSDDIYVPNTFVDCFIVTSGNPDSGNDYGAYNSSGKIGTNSGRPANDPYQFFDAIYAGQVEDLRLSARKLDVNKLREDAIRKSVAGTMRGKGKAPFTTFTNRVIGSGSHSARAEGYRMVNSNAYIYADWQSGDYANGELVTVWDTTKGVKFTGKVILIDTGAELVLSHVSTTLTNGNSATTTFVGTEKELTPEFDDLPWVDIIGKPERIAATFPNGVVGQWIPQIPDGTSKEYLFNRKVSDARLTQKLYTTDDGVTWLASSSSGLPIDSVRNSITEIWSGDTVGLDVYTTKSNFTEAANSSKVVGGVGDVLMTQRYLNTYGNRVCGSLIGKVATSNTGQGSINTFVGTMVTDFLENGELSNVRPISHAQLDFAAPQNNSPAVKALSTITEKDGLLYLQLHGSELKYHSSGDNRWGDTVAGTIYTSPYGVIPIVDKEATRTDLNGNVVKTFCHHTMIPLGIADNIGGSSVVTLDEPIMTIPSYYEPVTKPSIVPELLPEI